ncbi:MAG: YjdF family protein [Lachnospiraceae bacterium]|nr:YjdF family protein [Lachnospiraceae bacterium]
MDKISVKLTVYFEEPFWVGVFERISEEKLSACKVIFGAEPKDYEVCDFVVKHYYELQFSLAVKTEMKQISNNPKRRQRIARKQLQNSGIGTKSQQILQIQREERKIERRKTSKEQRDAEKLRQFELKQKKRKEKHRGH